MKKRYLIFLFAALLLLLCGCESKKEVKTGYECGLVFENFNDIKVEDQIEAYIMVEVPR